MIETKGKYSCFMVFDMFSDSTVVWLYECSICVNDLYTFCYFFVSKISKNMEYVTQNLVQKSTLIAILVLSIIVISYFISVTGYSRKK